MPDVSVIIPTYREAGNLSLLIPRVAGVLEPPPEIIVVDDDSRDGTEELCRELEKEHPLRLIVRTGERGLSSAVIAGMREANGALFVVMDADLSHPPERIPELVKALNDPAVDFALGSRYVSGGSVSDDWGWFRRVNSRVATALARPLTAVKDPMAGFFAIRRSSFEAVSEILDPIGYKIALELIVKGRFRNVLELPIDFAERQSGQSKLDLRERWNYLRHLGSLYAFRVRGWFRSESRPG